MTLILAACGEGPTAAHFEAVLDGLNIPAGWELVHTTIREPGGPDRAVHPGGSKDDIGCTTAFSGCPSVARYYLVDGRPIDAFPLGKQVVLGEGFQIESEFGPKCELLPSSPACGVNAAKGSDLIQMTLYNPGDDFDGIGVATEGQSLIRIIAEGK